MEGIGTTAGWRDRLPAGRRLRLAIAGLIAIGTAVPLALSSPGGPGTGFLRVTANPTTDTTAVTTTTLAPAAPAVTATTTTTAKADSGPQRATTNPVRTTVDGTAVRPTPTTTAPAVTAPTVASPDNGVPSDCMAPAIMLAVSTDRQTYQPGDTVQITVAAVNRGSRSCLLSVGPSQTLPSNQCQAESLVEAPWSASLPNVYEVMADVAPACSGTVHLLAPGAAWRTTVPVIIPGIGSWPVGSYNIHSAWQTPTLLVSAEVPFSLVAGPVTTLPAPTTTTPTTSPPNSMPTDSTTSLP